MASCSCTPLTLISVGFRHKSQVEPEAIKQFSTPMPFLTEGSRRTGYYKKDSLCTSQHHLIESLCIFEKDTFLFCETAATGQLKSEMFLSRCRERSPFQRRQPSRLLLLSIRPYTKPSAGASTLGTPRGQEQTLSEEAGVRC